MANNKTMKPIKWKDGSESLFESLGISNKRAGEIEYRLRLIIHEVQKPTKKGEESPGSDVFIKMCLGLAETEEERILYAYVAGSKVPELYDDNEYIESEEEDED